MMKIIFVVLLPLAWSYGAANSEGGGAFAFVDSSGHRYGGTYGLKDGRVVSRTGDEIPQHFADNIPFPQPFADTVYQGGEDDFGQNYFFNLENLLQEVFHKNLDNQRLAFDAARKAFDLTSNQAGGYAGGYPGGYSGGYAGGYPGGYSGGYAGGYPGGYSGGYNPDPIIASRFPVFPNMPSGFGGPPPFSNYGNSAFASAAAGPGYQHHVASIYPTNPGSPNVNRFADTAAPSGDGKFYSVSSNSYSSSSNVNGKETNQRGAETYVNDNGKVTHYKVKSPTS